jgi:CRP-like cAMP-binding protein
MTTSAPRIFDRSDFFKSLTLKNKNRLSSICLPRPVRRKDVLFREGDRGTAVFLCVKGSVQLHKTAPSGQEVVIKVVRSGELFAEAILFEKDRYPVTAVALENGLILKIPVTRFNRLLEDPEFRDDFIANLMHKLRYLADQVQFLTAHDVEDRLFRFLRDRFGNSDNISTGLTKKDVAAAIGTTPETLSRLLQRLGESGRLSWKGRRIRIPGAG